MRVISKADFAREAGVTASAMSKVLSTALKDALSGDGIDADHPAAIKYLSRCGQVGRPLGGGNDELSDYIRSRSDKLRHYEEQLPESFAPLVKNVADNLFYLGFAAGRMPGGERTERTAFVERSLDLLREAAG